MPEADFIIFVYLLVVKYYGKVVQSPLRRRGFAPKLSDEEAITMQLVGEFLGLDEDKRIYQHFKNNYASWFPCLGSYPNFCKQLANLGFVCQAMLTKLGQDFGALSPFCVDGFPIAVCHYARARRCRVFKGLANFGYCAAKQEKYFGFKGQIIVSAEGLIVAYTLIPANTDERATLDEVTDHLQGVLIGDKGYISQELRQVMQQKGIDLQIPYRQNMKAKHSPSHHNWLCKQRKTVEVVISQLVERFHIAKTKTKDIHHFSHRFVRKLLSHTTAVVICKLLGYPALQLTRIS